MLSIDRSVGPLPVILSQSPVLTPDQHGAMMIAANVLRVAAFSLKSLAKEKIRLFNQT